MDIYMEEVPGVGDIEISRHAQDRIGPGPGQIPESVFWQVLTRGEEIREGADIVWKTGKGIRIVILLRPIPYRGRALVNTAFKLKPPERIRS